MHRIRKNSTEGNQQELLHRTDKKLCRINIFLKYNRPQLRTGRKWIVQEAVDEAKDSLKMSEIIGHTQTNRLGLGSTEMKWWSKTKGKEKRDMVTQEVRKKEDAQRVQKAVQQAQQGQWTTRESALQRSLTWNYIWHMAPLRLSFIVRSVYDTLLSNASLVRWNLSNDPKCPLCQGRQTVEHVPSSCKVALAHGRYTWRHNQVLKQIAYAVSDTKRKPPTAVPQATFYSANGGQPWPRVTAPATAQKQGLLDGAGDWECSADLPEWKKYPEAIRKMGLRPDIVLHSSQLKQMILIELTVPWESRMEEAHVYKTEKYASLASSLKKYGFHVKVLAVDIGARGFVSKSAYDLMKHLSVSGRMRTRALKAMSEAAEKSLIWIWSRSNENELHKS